MRIDSHQHFWNYDPVRDSWITDDMGVLRSNFLPEHLLPLLTENKIDGCVAVQADQSTHETDFLLQQAKEHSFIRGVVGWIDLRSSTLEGQVEAYSDEKKLKGFRHIVQSEPAGFLRNTKFIDGVREIAKRGYTYDLLIYAHQMEDALYFLSQTQDVKIVIDHIAKPSIRTGHKTQWELQLAAMSTFENVCCKVSGMVTEADWKNWKKEDIVPFLDEVFESFGPARIMYGSDWPVCMLAARYDAQLKVVTDYIQALSSSEQEQIMGGTAVTFYNL
jgi:L-fuconolactonase